MESGKSVDGCKILVKGPCDLSNSLSYIHASEKIVSEFTYVDNRGMVIDTYNHSVHIRGLHEYSDADNQMLIDECTYIDPAMLKGTFFTGDYDLIFLSSLFESSYNVYRRKGTNVRVVMNSYNNYLESDEKFLSKYELSGMTKPEEYVQFLKDCLGWLSKKTTLCVILGATYGGSKQALRHKALNDTVKALAATEPRIKYIDVDEFAKSDADFTDGLNHYQTRVYFEIAQEMIRIAGEVTGTKIEGYGASKARRDKVLVQMRNAIKKHISKDSGLFKLLQKVYRKMVNK